ncbi:MAG: dehydrogenase, short-chain alcohol dehydrogenase like protein [Mycobacterium sp.]|jgi:2-hydroxycyclohexanecarboxyl-CoA dehydrogenase|nr:dehydrogenase, short-chain alcohol dehydrogenase like protein [Mycobacterium sp.]
MTVEGRLAGKVAVVTGGGQGIGRGIAKAFAAEGAAIVIVDLNADTARDAAKECADRGVEAVSLECDVADREQVDATVAEAVKRLGSIDILVTCALAKVKVQPFEQTPLSGIEKMWRVGYLGVVNMMQASLPHLRERRGNVINFGSGAGIGAAAGYASYGPVKEAVRAITRISAREWGAYGVRVNEICPFAKSDQFDEWAAGNPEQAAMALGSAALGRLGDCEHDIGRAAVFLASGDAGYITGHSLMVDGGQGMPL